MAAWVLECSNCHSNFLHTKIEDGIMNFFFPEKPEFPDGGQSVACTNCGHTAVYQPNQLTYQR